jgi:hypothetical protein
MNLLLVTHTEQNQHLILPAVVQELRKLNEGIRARVVNDVEPRLKHRVWTLGLPTTVISMRPVATQQQKRFLPRWATVWQQMPLNKIDECRVLEGAGIRVPKWAATREGWEPDLSGFREFVVVKPAEGKNGALVRVMRRARVRWGCLTTPSILTGTNRASEALLVQEYVHTGPLPTSYRVGTVFGEPIYAFRFVADRARRPFESVPLHSKDFDGRNIVASSKGCSLDCSVPEDVIELARQAHRAFPTVPLLGIDIIREHGSGQLYVLEANVWGGTFHLTSPVYQRILRESGIDLRTQFGGAAAVACGIARRVQAGGSW